MNTQSNANEPVVDPLPETPLLEPSPPVAAAGVESDGTPPAAPGGQGETQGAVEAPPLEMLRQQVREQLLAARLPRGMRECLADALPDVIATSDAGPQVAVSAVLRALEAALPANWRTDPAQVEPREHPAGEAFFTGEGPLSEQQAAQVAREQLKRHGFLAG